MGYIGEPLDVDRFFAELPGAATKAGFAVEYYGQAAGWPLIALRRTAKEKDAPRLYLSSGIHGDEPAGPLALLRLIEQGFFDDRFHWIVLPALNPGGLAAKTRENPGGVDVNRDYKSLKTSEAAQHMAWFGREKAAGRCDFALTLLLHEDWESCGFYLYELNSTPDPMIGPSVLAAVDSICGVDRSPEIEGMPATNGLITRPMEAIREMPMWPEAVFLALKHTQRSMTLEAPSMKPLELRVAAHNMAVRTAVGAWDKLRGGS